MMEKRIFIDDTYEVIVVSSILVILINRSSLPKTLGSYEMKGLVSAFVR